ncbi:hypothetical protein P43SY_010801 [Pythium insidiosum]|uniref:Transmembrane protein n=1 Tax=Pythium insidiosum TaxID=114742 RepID=A0AAD5L8I1_PYTIN|nr:hypothetical protein P43SY_010801 [Pythium insidiosum]
MTKPTPVVLPDGPSASRVKLPACPGDGPTAVYLSFGGYLLARATVVLILMACVAYLIAAGLVLCMIPGTNMVWPLRTYTTTLDPQYFTLVGNLHFAMAALYLAVTVKSLQLHERVLAILKQHFPTDRNATSQLGQMVQSFTASRRLRAVKTGYRLLWSRQGLFGIDGPHFDLLFAWREVVETVLQTYQAYQMSVLLPRAALNRIFVTLLVASCWSTPLVHRVIQRRAVQRLLCIFIDAVIDMTAAIVVPALIALSYLGDYDPNFKDFTLTLWYTDKWLVNFVNESSIVLFGSWLDVISRCIFLLGLLSSLNRALSLIKYRRVAVAQSTQLFVTWSHRLIALNGVVVLGLHVYATFGPPVAFCVLEVRPWLIREDACALVEINCHPRIPGHAANANATTMTQALEHLTPTALAHFGVRHCTNLTFTVRR